MLLVDLVPVFRHRFRRTKHPVCIEIEDYFLGLLQCLGMWDLVPVPPEIVVASGFLP